MTWAASRLFDTEEEARTWARSGHADYHVAPWSPSAPITVQLLIAALGFGAAALDDPQAELFIHPVGEPGTRALESPEVVLDGRININAAVDYLNQHRTTT